jgi:hypothetical protein
MDNGVEPVGMVPLAREPLKPYAIGHQEVIECSMHALEECTDIAAIVGVTERKRRMVEPSVGPTIVGCELFEVSFHGTTRLREDTTFYVCAPSTSTPPPCYVAPILRRSLPARVPRPWHFGQDVNGPEAQTGLLARLADTGPIRAAGSRDVG